MSKNVNWDAKVAAVLRAFLRFRKGPFLAEDFVQFAKGKVAPPEDPRNWGAPIRQAAQAGVITKTGYGLASTSNRSPKCLWRKAG